MSVLGSAARFCLVSLALTGAALHAAETREVRGTIVDAADAPVAQVVVSYFWRANGTGQGDDGQTLDLTKPENMKRFWGNVGQMEPLPEMKLCQSDAAGHFSLEVPNSFHALMAMDPARKRGGLVFFTEEERDAVKIRLGPLAHMHGSVVGLNGKRPPWTMVEMRLPYDSRKPLSMKRLVVCGSFEANFSMLLPPGMYQLAAYNDTQDDVGQELNRSLILTADKLDVDLGTLQLQKRKPNINERIAHAVKTGAMRDHTEHYGEKLPEWRINDAKGLSKNAQLSDFKGKWVLLNFWSVSCSVCLKHDLPALAKFAESHPADRERFEVVALCVDPDQEFASIAELEKHIEPIVKHVWNGKPLPFPMLLDSSMTTMERYGMRTYGTILIDPESRLIAGDEATLAEKLKQ